MASTLLRSPGSPGLEADALDDAGQGAAAAVDAQSSAADGDAAQSIAADGDAAQSIAADGDAGQSIAADGDTERPPPPKARVGTMIHAGAPPGPAPLDAPATSSARMAAAAPLTRRCSSCGELYPADFLVCPRDATPLADESGEGAADPLVGKLLGETYQIVRVVGEGGMGRVYEARHLRLKERRFAVKTLHADLAHNPEMAARFLREAESASSIDHPNVVDVFDVHHLADGTPYLVGEFLEGEELARHVESRGPLDPRAAVDVARQIASALSAAHAHGIVHRDMKPENVFVTRAVAGREGPPALTIKVLDFGISKAGGVERTHLTRTGVIMGTPSYMAPEQARGQPVDHRADVYSLGAVLYFALTGKRPFDAEDPTTTLSMVLTQDPVRLRDHDVRIPEELELVVQRAMAKDAAERYPTMADLERALAAIGGPSKALASGASPPVTDEARTARPVLVVASVALGLFLFGGLTAALAGLVRVLHGGEVTLTEGIMLVVACLCALATPAVLYVLHVKRRIWPNSVRAVQLAADLRRTATAAIVGYGVASIALRVGHTVLWRTSTGLASGAWDIVLFLVGFAAAAVVGGAGPLSRRLRRRSRR